MSTLHIGPSHTNDARAHAAFQARISREDSPVYIPLYHVVEHNLLAGPWFGIRAFFNEKLPKMRAALLALLENSEVTDVHVDIGADLGTLYAAYYALLEGVPLRVTLHVPNDGQQYVLPASGDNGELRKSIPGKLCFGGDTLWAKTHPMVLRRLALTVLAGARDVWVTSQDDAERLFLTFPSLDRPIDGAPLNAAGSASGA